MRIRTRTLPRTLALIVTLVLAGCGFERAAPYAGARIPDVGPWTDLGPLVLCDGPAHIVAPSLGTAGLCTPSGSAAPTACASDADCRSRERCLCGSCSVALCDSADECGPPDGPLVCTFADRRCDHACDTDDQCARGERCVPGRHVCRGTCASTADCQHGERCDATGLCATTACAADADCGGLACARQRESGLVAHASPLAGSDGVTLYFDHTGDDGVAAIWRALGDGTHFTVDHMLFPGAAPSVARLPDGSFAMIFAGGASLFAARSPDGVAWSTPTPALGNARSPSLVIAPDGTPLLWAVDPDGNLTRFVGTPDLVFTTPVVALSPVTARTPLWPDIDALDGPFVEPYGDADGSPRLRLWFAAHGTESGPSSQFGTPTPTPPDWSIGVAVSTDYATFTPDAYDPVFDRVSDFINHPGELDPSVLSLDANHDHRRLLYYRRAKADGSAADTLAVATSPVQPN
ncbi:MAG TPA: hypothetical protein VN947_03895 [Polyangia bacterium]|nr:hypothetical protein [Polyangia bacterium]